MSTILSMYILNNILCWHIGSKQKYEIFCNTNLSQKYFVSFLFINYIWPEMIVEGFSSTPFSHIHILSMYILNNILCWHIGSKQKYEIFCNTNLSQKYFVSFFFINYIWPEMVVDGFSSTPFSHTMIFFYSSWSRSSLQLGYLFIYGGNFIWISADFTLIQGFINSVQYSLLLTYSFKSKNKRNVL